MKAAIVLEYGGLDKVSVQDVAVPETAPNEVLVQVTAASVNPLDPKLVSGELQAFFPLALPFVVGTDFSGVIVQAGADAAPWQAGDRALARFEPSAADGRSVGRTGALAEYAAVPSAMLARVPETVDLAAAAALPTAAGTAYQALFETARLQAGQTVLVHGGAGGVGGFAVQLAKNAGARVISTASAANLDFVRHLGADEVMDYQTQDFAASLRDVDVVLDTVGGETQQKSFGVLRRGGHLLSLVSQPDEAQAAARGVLAAWVFHQSSAARLDLLLGLWAGGRLQTEVTEVYPLAEAREALTKIASGHTRGKLLVTL